MMVNNANSDWPLPTCGFEAVLCWDKKMRRYTIFQFAHFLRFLLCVTFLGYYFLRRPTLWNHVDHQSIVLHTPPELPVESTSIAPQHVCEILQSSPSSCPIPSNSEPFASFVSGVEQTMRYAASGVYTSMECGPLPITERYHLNSSMVGNGCEAWIARYALMILQKVLRPECTRALEWGIGSSSSWYLLHVKHLFSIEHDKEWAKHFHSDLQPKWPAEFHQRWCGAVIPPAIRNQTRPTPHSFISQINATYDFESYCRAYNFLDERTVMRSFDFVVVDGRSRVGCLWTAVNIFIKEEGGIILLDNSARSNYLPDVEKIIPPHWIAFHDVFANFGDQDITTSLFMTCKPGNEVCASAKRRIQELVAWKRGGSDLSELYPSHLQPRFAYPWPI